MIPSHEQVDLAVGQIRKSENDAGVILCLMLGPSAEPNKWDVCVMSATGDHAAYITLGECRPHPAVWFLEETTVIA